MFRGLKSEPDAKIGQKGRFAKVSYCQSIQVVINGLLV